MKLTATLAAQGNRGKPSEPFVRELIDWANTAPADIFAAQKDPPAPNKDVYTIIRPDLGPWTAPEAATLHRRAALVQFLIVLAGRESTWKWHTGKDTTNPAENSPITISAGPWQVSANSRGFGKELRDLIEKHVGTMDGNAFQKAMKTNRPFAMEYTARLLRRTHRHHGPILRYSTDIHPYLTREATEEIQEALRG